MPRAQKEGAGITDPRRVAETVNQKAVQKEEAREVRQMFKPLREVWMSMGIERVDMHEGRTVRALLDSGATGLSQLCYGLVVTYCMVYHSTKRVTLARLLANESPAIYAVH